MEGMGRKWKTNLSITDNGKGISEQQLKIITDGGNNIGIKSGLGLHLVRDMAKAITCTISVTASPGKGTSFQLAI
jgi:signal transduction histidine kinase